MTSPYDEADDDSQPDSKPAALPPRYEGVPDGFPPSTAEQRQITDFTRTLEANMHQNPQLAQTLMSLISQTDGSQDSLNLLSQLQQHSQFLSPQAAKANPTNPHGTRSTTANLAASESTDTTKPSGRSHTASGGREFPLGENPTSTGTVPAGMTPPYHATFSLAGGPTPTPPHTVATLASARGKTPTAPSPGATTTGHHTPAPSVDAKTAYRAHTTSILTLAKHWSAHQTPAEVQAEAKAGVDTMTALAANPHDLTPLEHFLTPSEEGTPTNNRAFAVMNTDAIYWAVIHSVGKIVLSQDECPQPADWYGHNEWIGVIGSRRTRTIEDTGMVICQEPPVFTLDWEALATPHVHQEASRKRLDHMNAHLDDDDTPSYADTKGGTRVSCPNIMPIPWKWAAWFLDAQPAPAEAAIWVQAQTELWRTPPYKAIGAQLASFFRCGAGRNPTSSVAFPQSQLAVDLPPLAHHAHHLEGWLLMHLDASLPPLTLKPTPGLPPPLPSMTQPIPRRPLPPPPLDHPAPTPPATHDLYRALAETPPTGTGMDTLFHALASHYASAEERENRVFARQEAIANKKEGSKELPPSILHTLLKLAGLSIETQGELPAFWRDMHRQQSKEAKHAFINSFVDGLIETEPGFAGFRNRQLLDDLTAFRLAPGDTCDTLHHGLSPLAFLTRTPSAIQELVEAQDNYDNASNVTPTDLAARKAASKPPPIPTSFGDAMIPIRMHHVFIRHTLGPWCHLGKVLHSFEHHAKLLRNKVVGEPAILRYFLPQMYHYIIMDTRDFCNTTATLPEVRLPPGTAMPNPNRALSSFESPASQLLMLQDLRPLNVPDVLVAPFKAQNTNKCTGHPPAPPDHTLKTPERHQRPRLTNTGRFDSAHMPTGTQGPTPGTPTVQTPNSDPPGPFKSDTDLQRLLTKFPRIKLNEICIAAGYRNWTDVAREADLPRNLCGNYGVKGMCYDQCAIGISGGHAAAAHWPAPACTKALGLLRPGITAMLARPN
jgi:hypothetical protein